MMDDGDFRPCPLKRQLTEVEWKIKRLKNAAFFMKNRSRLSQMQSELRGLEDEQRDLQKRIARLERVGRN